MDYREYLFSQKPLYQGEGPNYRVNILVTTDDHLRLVLRKLEEENTAKFNNQDLTVRWSADFHHNEQSTRKLLVEIVNSCKNNIKKEDIEKINPPYEAYFKNTPEVDEKLVKLLGLLKQNP